jgi:signal peptidase II
MALHAPRAWALLLAVVVFGLAIDLASKSLAFEHIAPFPVHIQRADVLASDRLDMLIPAHDPLVVVPSMLELTLVLNPGAVFGVGAGKRWFFVAFTLIALGFAVWIFSRWTKPADRIAHISIGLIIAGGLGNLYDRLIFACVRDFIHPLPGLTLPFGIAWPGGNRDLWPYVSNIADLYLIVGIVALLFLNWKKA